MEPHTDPQIFTSAGQWINNYKSSASTAGGDITYDPDEARERDSVTTVRGRDLTGRGRAHQVPSPTLPVKTHAVGGPSKA